MVLGAFDQILISLYRLTGNPVCDYFIGTFLLAFLLILVGQGTLSLVFRVNRKHLATLESRVEELNLLSISAMEIDDRHSYRAVNKEANDAYGRLFFNRFGLSAAFLWPAFFGLAWMQERFADVTVPIPILGVKANYFVVFLISYVLARIVFGRARRCLSYRVGIAGNF